MHKIVLGLVCLALPAFAGKRIDNDFETVGKDEDAKIEEVKGDIKARLKKTRDAHAKSHGCVDDVTVQFLDKENLREGLRVGLFQPGKKYAAMIRFSPGDGNPDADDRAGGGQGFALKLLLEKDDAKTLVPVIGETEHYVDPSLYATFDIVTISRNREFFVENVADYRAFFHASGEAGVAAKAVLAGGGTPADAGKAARDKLIELYVKPDLKKVGKPDATTPIYPRLRPREGVLLDRLGAARPKNVLLETYNSWVPSLFGKSAVKYEITPCDTSVSPDKFPVPAAVGDWTKDKNFLRAVLKHELSTKKHCFKLSVQQFKKGSVDFEDAVASWGEAPYEEVAVIEIPQKTQGKELVDDETCEAASFHPGHAPAAHYPAGNIQRSRVGTDKLEGIYTMTAKLRNQNAGRKPR